MIKILHIIQQLSKGGAARSMIATAKYSAQYGNFHHQVISLLPSETLAKQQAEVVGMSVIDAPNHQVILDTIEKADIVHVHWWNNPHLYDLLRSDLPAMRLLTWFHVAGDQPPHVITKQLIDHSDFALACSPYTYNRKAFQDLNSETKTSKTGMVIAGSDFEPIKNYQKRSHDGFNVGYIGTVDFVKMHPNYVAMSAKVDIPDVHFVVCGGGISNYLAQQAQQLGASDKFDFRGYVEDIKSVLEILDIYGYPLCEETYAAAELNLQEVMYCGIPPVVFPYGGVKNLIQHNETGLIVNSEKEYKEAIEYLYHHPEERERLGNNARKYALEIFGAENAGKAINPIYEKLMQQPKRERIWGIPVGTSLLDLPITLEDLTGEYRQPTPAELFIEGLGGTKPEFIVSMTSQDINELFEAEEKIALSSPLVRSAGSGGIIHYCNSYPNDGYLRLWTGLVLEASQQYAQAIQNYINAINLGCNHWRVVWYLARVAEKANNLELAEKAVSNVLQGVPNFINAQELLERITNCNLFPINFQTLNLIIFPDWQQDEEELSLTLTEVLKSIAPHPQAEEITLIIDTTNAESEEDAQMLVSAVTLNLMLEEGIELSETTEINFVRNLNSQQWQKLFTQMGNSQLYYLPFPVISQWENIPESPLESYCKYLLQNCQIFLNNGDSEKYLDYYSYLLQNLVQNIEKDIQSQLWQKIALIFTENLNFIPCYFNDQNLKEIYINRAKILEFTLRIKGFQLEYEFLPREVKQEKIKIGILSAHYGIQTETFSTLPIYNHLDRDKFDITLLTIRISNHRLEKYCFAHGDRVIQLPSTLSEQVDIIRSYDLDILFIGTNITARSHSITYLALHRLARIQIIDPNSPVSSGFPSIDYYISSKLSESLPTAQEHYTEELITLNIPPQCFDFGTEANLKTDQIITREDLGLKADQIVFVSGANYFKIIPEVEETWIKILTKVANSVLVLYPFNPNWSNNYPISLFQERIFKTLQKYNIAEDRLIILEPVKNSLEIKERLKICDIYLDSFPYSGMTSMIDPLSVSLPTIVFSGDTSRSQKAASILRYFDLEDLIAYSLEEYIEKAVLLGQNRELRREYLEKITEKMQSNPSFLDSKTYSQNIEKIFINLYEKYHYENTIIEFKLTNINYLIFPDWQRDEEVLSIELTQLIYKLANNSSLSNDNPPVSDSPLTKGGWGGSTLVIDTTGITEEDANLLLSGIAMNLMMEEELDLENTLDFALINNLNEQQCNKLLPKITAKITLENENQEIINQFNIEDLVSIDGNGNNYAIFPDWKADQEELASEIAQVLMNLSEEENCTLLVNLDHVDREEVGLFFSEIAMNLMLINSVELSDNLQINFVNFTANQWQSLEGLIKEKITINSENLPDNLFTES
ncbi:glycosyltransferase [Geminocystis sp. CENA526]|uniref:glycosyltransferase n=1 Tax=Geminocystis sp. CENA526 TaxID=1355871 RepID=UPI003D6E415E